MWAGQNWTAIYSYEGWEGGEEGAVDGWRELKKGSGGGGGVKKGHGQIEDCRVG